MIKKSNEKSKENIILETDKNIIVTNKEVLETLKGIKRGLDDFAAGRYTIKNQ